MFRFRTSENSRRAGEPYRDYSNRAGPKDMEQRRLWEAQNRTSAIESLASAVGFPLWICAIGALFYMATETLAFIMAL